MRLFTLAVLVLVTGCAASLSHTIKVSDVRGGHGSAFAIGATEDAYICLTANHVLSRPEGTNLIAGGKVVGIILQHRTHDIAMISVPKGDVVLKVYKTARPQIGPARAIGFGGLSQDVVITQGDIISLTSGPHGIGILADIRVMGGMSGGVLEQHGKAVGVVVGVPPGFGQSPHTGLSWFEPVYLLTGD